MAKTVEQPAYHDILCGTCGRRITYAYGTAEDAADQAYQMAASRPNGVWECEACGDKRLNPRGDYCLTESWAYDNYHPAGVTVEILTARKTHPCSRHRDCEIKPGHVYIRQTVAPWVMVADDVDEEGRTIGSRNGEWSVSKWHRYDDDANEDRKGECRFSDCRVMPGQPHTSTCPHFGREN